MATHQRHPARPGTLTGLVALAGLALVACGGGPSSPEATAAPLFTPTHSDPPSAGAPSPSASPEATVSSEPPSQVSIPIWFDGPDFRPREIVLYVGQEVRLDLFNPDVEPHSFVIGRGLITENGLPVGYETDFFADQPFGYLGGGGDGVVQLFNPPDAYVTPEEQLENYYLEPHERALVLQEPYRYQGDITILLPRTRLFWWLPGVGSVQWGVIYTALTRSHMSMGIVEFTVEPFMVGEWEFACLSEGGRHYLRGEHGRLIIRRP